MGEIYRSVSVTGTRLLATDRLSRVKQRDEFERSRDQGAAEHGEKPPAQKSQAPQPPATAMPAEAESQALQEDLLIAQQRRLEQLEEDNATLQKELASAEAALEQASEQLQSEEAEHRERGYQDGYDEAQKKAGEDLAKMSAELVRARELFTDALQSQMETVNQYAVEVTFAALARIIGQNYADSNFSKAIVEEALTEVQGSGKVEVHISQQDFDLLQGIEATLADTGRLTEVELIADPRVSVGGCLIETDNGVWDARLETQLQRLKDAIALAMRNPS